MNVRKRVFARLSGAVSPGGGQLIEGSETYQPEVTPACLFL